MRANTYENCTRRTAFDPHPRRSGWHRTGEMRGGDDGTVADVQWRGRLIPCDAPERGATWPRIPARASLNLQEKSNG
jgi:hypothetical protein